MAKKINQAPQLPSLLIIADDPYLAAQASAVFAKKGYYTPVIDAPRLARHDRINEVIRRTNIAARYQPKSIVLAGATEEVKEAFKGHLPLKRLDYISSIEELKTAKAQPETWPQGQFTWGKNDIGLGLLQALRNKQEIVFTDQVMPRAAVNPEHEHMVVCEDGDALAQVIAANYAFSINAGLCIVPEVPDQESEDICESFYSSAEPGQFTQTERLEHLKSKLRDWCKDVPIDGKRQLTFVTRKVPWGFAFPEVPTTHIFSYPDMGISILNAIIAEQPDMLGLTFSLLIDPQQVQANEISAVAKSFRERGILIKVLQGAGANVSMVSKNVALMPYDFLVISTHCGDSSGWQWTYEYRDSEGIDRTLVIDVAAGFGSIPNDEDKYEVMMFSRFVSLDGVDWNDPLAKEKLYVGTAIIDYINRTGKLYDLEPVKKEEIPRVVGSSALKMWDHNFIPMPESIGGEGTPIILNNACSSWHRLSSTFMFANARAYMGTLFEVLDAQAHEVAIRLTDKYFGKPLALALWRVQNDVYQGSIKRPYIMVGPHFQRLRTAGADGVPIVFNRMKKAYLSFTRKLSEQDNADYAVKKINENLAFLKSEMETVFKKFIKPGMEKRRSRNRRT